MTTVSASVSARLWTSKTLNDPGQPVRSADAQIIALLALRTAAVRGTNRGIADVPEAMCVGYRTRPMRAGLGFRLVQGSVVREVASSLVAHRGLTPCADKARSDSPPHRIGTRSVTVRVGVIRR